MVGRALWRALETEGFAQIIGRTRAELDLRETAATDAFLQSEKPDVILIAAAKVGGIEANRTQPADFLFDNRNPAQHLPKMQAAIDKQLE